MLGNGDNICKNAKPSKTSIELKNYCNAHDEDSSILDKPGIVIKTACANDTFEDSVINRASSHQGNSPESQCLKGTVTCEDGFVQNSNPRKSCHDECDGACCYGSRDCEGFSGRVCKVSIYSASNQLHFVDQYLHFGPVRTINPAWAPIPA